MELLAIVGCLGHCRSYLMGTKVTIVTDHMANHWVLHKQRHKSAVSMRQTLWAVLLGEYDYDDIYKPSRKHRNADALSGPPIEQPRPQDAEYGFDPVE